MWSSYVFMCSLPVKHTTGTGFLTVPPALWFCFSLSFLFIWDFAYIVSSFLSATQSAQSRERAMQAGFSCSSSPFSCVLYLPRNSVPLGVVWLRVKKYNCPPHLPSILHTVDQTDSASLKVIVAGLIPLGWMCMVCTSPPHFRNLKTTKNKRQLFNLSRVTLKALYIYL